MTTGTATLDEEITLAPDDDDDVVVSPPPPPVIVTTSSASHTGKLSSIFIISLSPSHIISPTPSLSYYGDKKDCTDDIMYMTIE